MAVVAKDTYRVAGKPGQTLVRKGHLYEDDDPRVKAHPTLFETPEDNQRATTKATSTEELGAKSMSARRRRPARDGVEDRRQAPGEVKSDGFPCGIGKCPEILPSEERRDAHYKKAHGGYRGAAK